MENKNDWRFTGTVDHIAVRCDDLEKDVEEYKVSDLRSKPFRKIKR